MWKVNQFVFSKTSNTQMQNHFEGQLVERDSKIEAIEGQLIERDSKIEGQLVESGSKIEAIEGQLAQKDQQISQLTNTVNQLTNTVNEMKNQIQVRIRIGVCHSWTKPGGGATVCKN